MIYMAYIPFSVRFDIFVAREQERIIEATVKRLERENSVWLFEQNCDERFITERSPGALPIYTPTEITWNEHYDQEEIFATIIRESLEDFVG